MNRITESSFEHQPADKTMAVDVGMKIEMQEKIAAGPDPLDRRIARPSKAPQASQVSLERAYLISCLGSPSCTGESSIAQ